ncbi:MAG: beta-glucuronidase [Fusicatenibacter sp.]|nr:beta-glucuronidase [Lachnospiraceae bacterium]MDY2937893.1 beta-glucuronidase [Fusicatenibacter sp.]
MAQNVKLKESGLPVIRNINPRLVSYNVEMTEVTGGTFWTAYTEAQIDGTEQVPPPDFSKGTGLASMHQWYDPIDTTNPRLIKLAKELGECWIRVSGTWATRTYYDFDGTGMPEGYSSHLRKEQWINLLNFVKAVGGKLKISVANCDGLHRHDEPWHPTQAKLIFDLSREMGCPIEAVEFVNEPNLLTSTGFPKDYTPEDFRRDQDIFHKWVRENYPECTIVGPSDTDPRAMTHDPDGNPYDGKEGGAGIADALPYCTTGELLDGCTEKLDVFSYHCYNGVSERMAALAPDSFSPYEECMSEDFLGMAGRCARCFSAYRDRYAVPGGEMWVTESAGAGAGGHTWASTYAEVPRTLNEIAEFATVTDGVIFHNTLASSDYGWLKHGSFIPRPSYFAVLLWKRIMGNTVYASGEAIREGAHVYAHSRKDGKPGYAYLVINNSWTETTSVELPKTADVYALTGNGKMRSRTMLLNGRELILGESDELPELTGKTVEAGIIEVAPGGCTFIVL